MSSRKNILTLALAILLCAPVFAFNFDGSDTEFGKAAYYSDKFQGKNTASGQPYDKNDFTCAHKTYPFGTILRITRLDNQKSVDVRVNDRGPYAEGHVVDLSRAAAEAIDLVKAGVSQVKVELVEKPAAQSAKGVTAPATYSTPSTQPSSSKSGVVLIAPKTTPEVEKTAPKEAPKEAPEKKSVKGPGELYTIEVKSVAKTGFGVQLYTLSNVENTLPEIAKLEKTWPGKVMLLRNETDGNIEHKIIIGPYTDRKSADAQLKIATKKGHPKCFVVDLKNQ